MRDVSAHQCSAHVMQPLLAASWGLGLSACHALQAAEVSAGALRTAAHHCGCSGTSGGSSASLQRRQRRSIRGGGATARQPAGPRRPAGELSSLPRSCVVHTSRSTFAALHLSDASFCRCCIHGPPNTLSHGQKVTFDDLEERKCLASTVFLYFTSGGGGAGGRPGPDRDGALDIARAAAQRRHRRRRQPAAAAPAAGALQPQRRQRRRLVAHVGAAPNTCYLLLSQSIELLADVCVKHCASGGDSRCIVPDY